MEDALQSWDHTGTTARRRHDPMIPDSYHPFFSGCASVAGALIGLLFVAISVAPHKIAGERAEVAFRVGAAAAFVALLNTLFVALSALLPGTNLPTTAALLASLGICSVTGLVVISLRSGGIRQNPAVLARLGALLVALTLQLASALSSFSGRRHGGTIHTQAILCLILFVIAINQAWRLLDPQGTRLIPLLLQLLKGRRAALHAADSPMETGEPFSDHFDV
jgi:hypothetical protein